MSSKVKIRKTNIGNMGVILYLIYAFFSDLISAVQGSAAYRYSLWIITLGLIFCAVSNSGRFHKRKYEIIFTLCALFFVLFRNQAFKNGDYITTIRWIFCFVFCFFFANFLISFNDLIRYMACIGFVHVIGTFVFWLIPNLYSTMYSIWGYWPSGTSYGAMGYKAGLTNHYSHNGIVLAVTYLALFALVFSSVDEKNSNSISSRKKRIYKIMFAISMFAVVLTTKRAHLMFGILAMIFVYYFYNPKNIGTRTFKLIVACTVGLTAFFVAARYVPTISAILDRFSGKLTEDSTMLSRFVFWRLALSMFIQKPVCGYGWFGFRYQYRTYLYDPTVRSARYELLDCHNVYLQVLAETGVVGFVFYIAIAFWALKTAFYLIRNKREILRNNSLDTAMFFSTVFQLFYLLYSLTGNCLYDITSAFYMLSIALTFGCNNFCKLKARECCE